MFTTPAFAQSNPLSSLFGGGGDSASMITSFMPLILIIVIMYFLILRPQQRKVKLHQEMVKALRRGDTVVTNGGSDRQGHQGGGREPGRDRNLGWRAGAELALEHQRGPGQERAGKRR